MPPSGPGGVGTKGRASARRRYAGGLALGVAGIGLRQALAPALGAEFPLLTFFPPVIAASWLGGFGPAVLALGVTLAGGAWAMIPAGGAVGPSLGLGIYALTAGGLAYCGDRLRARLGTAEAERSAATARLAELEEHRRADRESEARLRREQEALRETSAAQARRLEDLLGEVREKNAFMTAILRQAPSGIVVAEAGTARLLLSNDEAERIVRGDMQPGLQLDGRKHPGELVGLRPDGTRYEPDEWPMSRSLFRGEVVRDEEIELAFADGLRRRISINSGPALDDRGRVIAAVAAFDDVTERRAAEADLAESERRFRQLAEAIPQMVYITRPDDSIAYLNRRWFEYTGASGDHLEVRDAWLASIHPEDVPRVRAARIRSKEAGEPTELEYRIKGASGAYRWFLGRSMWIRDDRGELLYRFGTITDIDGRKRSEQAARFLADAGARLAAVADAETTLREIAGLAVPFFADWCAVDVLDEGGGLRRVAVAHDSPDAAEVIETVSHRYRLREDMPQGLFEVVASRRPTLIPEVAEEHLRSGARDDEHLAALRAFNPRSYLCVPLAGREGVLGALSFVATTSGRRYDQADLELAVDLAGRAAIALENGRLYDRLREADRRKDDFLATLAHELRNPMAPIRNSVQILRKMGGADPDSQWAGEVIERQVGHLSRLIDDLLDVSRITRAKLELKAERIDLAAAVGDAVEITRPIVDREGHELRLELPAEPLPIHGDRTRLAQVVANLLDNASKFSERGARIDLRVARRGGQVEVRVEDRGAGIPPEQLPRVFEMFAQVTPILQRPKGGLGIGLALVKGIVELHGGSVEARSAGPGRGSEFVVRLPLARDEGQGGETGAEAEAAGDRSKPRVLIVDDGEDVAATLGRVLTLEGCEVHLARDGVGALAMAGALRPDYAVLDIGLPGMDGYQVARAIRDQPWGRDLTLIAVTGWGRNNDRNRSREAGFDHHLVKPVDPSALARLIARPAS
ncbi:ATP-binding protein [Paludisphaera soli]|uniref:ATP-binding protein n=1 Tax=Paludisphaera soli TaxID=2712865 RepID=UPI0013EB5C40|nr:ATP-binding protein [Paludisphaera soli]